MNRRKICATMFFCAALTVLSVSNAYTSLIATITFNPQTGSKTGLSLSPGDYKVAVADHWNYGSNVWWTQAFTMESQYGIMKAGESVLTGGNFFVNAHTYSNNTFQEPDFHFSSLVSQSVSFYLSDSNYGDNYGSLTLSVYNESVPEPSTMLLLGSGLAGLVGYGRRRK